MRGPKAMMCSEENAKKDTAMEGHSLDILETIRRWPTPNQNTTQLVEIRPLVPADLPCLGRIFHHLEALRRTLAPQWGCVQAVLYELRMKCGG